MIVYMECKQDGKANQVGLLFFFIALSEASALRIPFPYTISMQYQKKDNASISGSRETAGWHSSRCTSSQRWWREDRLCNGSACLRQLLVDVCAAQTQDADNEMHSRRKKKSLPEILAAAVVFYRASFINEPF